MPRLKLIPPSEDLDETALHDLWILHAKNIEDALQDCGAEAHEDYTVLDLFTLAGPLVADHFRDQRVTMTKAWKT